MPTTSVQDYLKAVYQISETGGRAGTSALAERLGVSPASVTEMLRKLSRSRPQLVSYQKHHGATLTAEGRREALEVIRHHRLIEAFLHRTLGLPWDQIHAEAERIEHAISEDLEDRIDEHLGYPTVDPHGGPIPEKDGTLPAPRGLPLADLALGQPAEVSLVPDEDPALLRYLAEVGLVPGAVVKVEERDPFEGSLHLTLGTGLEPRAVSPAVCRQILVIPLEVEERSV
jgi:DtxR family Mn-dependent transcriptional regulator